jgi:hypothetical protein
MGRTPKPWYRARNVVVGIVLIGALLTGLEVRRAVTAKPGVAVDYWAKLRELQEGYQPPGPLTPEDNAWTVVENAVADWNTAMGKALAMRRDMGRVDFSILRAGPRYGAKDPDKAAVWARTAELLREMEGAGAFAELERASRVPQAVHPVGGTGGPMIAFLLPSLSQLRETARIGGARMYLATADGDGARLARAYEETLAVGRVCTQQTFLIEHLVGFAIIALANGELACDLNDRQWDEATLRACMEALDRQRALMAPLELALEAERCLVLDTIQWTHTDNGRGDGRLILTALKAYTSVGAPPAATGGSWFNQLLNTSLINVAGVAFASKKAITRKTNEHFDHLLNYYRLPIPERKVAVSPDVLVEGLSRRYLFLGQMLPALGKSVQSDAQGVLQLDGTRVLLAIEIFRARHGRDPETLGELTPEILPQPARDPFTGGPFGYRRLAPGEDRRGRRYLLYSFGWDGVDNGGAMDAHETPLGLREAGAGKDHVINIPREDPEETEDESEPADKAPEAAEPAPVAEPGAGP